MTRIGRRLSLFVLYAACVIPSLSAAGNLQTLDQLLRKDFITPRQQRIDSLRIASTKNETPWLTNFRLAQAYADFNADSALYHIRLAEVLAADSSQHRRTLLCKAGLYNSSLVMYKEASDIFRSLTPDPDDADFSRDYYTLGVQLYRNLEDLTPEPDLKQEYARLKRQYRDSVLALSPGSILIDANRLLDNGNLTEALALLLPEAEKTGFTPANGAVYHTIARAYELQGNADMEIHYLTLAAQADISNGVREYIALPRLAYLLYEKGDISRAFDYLQRSINDAYACNARLRLLNMSETMSVISGAHGATQRSSRILLLCLSVMLGLLLLITGVSLYYARRQNRLLHRSQLNLQSLNSQLAASGNMREKYARRFMRLSLEFMDQLNHYRLYLLKIASRRNFNDLHEAISSTATVEREADVFYHNFDTAFLELYPDFVAEFNALLRPDERITPKDDKSLNTELRIFALMKLGITESAEIAKLLHCSQSTVYNYRTRYRAKAIDKEDFLRRIFPDKTT